jgi:hypothetical protein
MGWYQYEVGEIGIHAHFQLRGHWLVVVDVHQFDRVEVEVREAAVEVLNRGLSIGNVLFQSFGSLCALGVCFPGIS